MADDINQASVMKKVEEEYRLCKQRKLLKKSTKIKCAPEKLHATFSKHFKERPEPKTSNKYYPKLIDLEQIIPKTEVEIDMETPEVWEIEFEMEKRIKNGRCKGTDGLVGEQLKYAKESDKLPGYIHEIVKRIWDDGQVPESWKISRLKPIFKNKGSQTD